MTTIYEILRAPKGKAYSESQIIKKSWLYVQPELDKPAGVLAGNSRVHGDASSEVQDRVIDILIEIGTRYKLPYRDIAHLLLFCKVESGFNPDAAAGTSSAGGLGQYTIDTVVEAAKSHISKKRLGFSLDLSGNYLFDAERGAYGVVLSYMIAKEKAIHYFDADYEKYTYLFHHEGWYFKPTDEHMGQSRTKEVLGIINKKILPHLDQLEILLSAKNDVEFKLITADDKPYTEQPYVAIYPKNNTMIKKAPLTVQGVIDGAMEYVFGKTDAKGKTKPISTSGLSEVLFVVLNKDYKNYLQVNSTQTSNTHTVEKGETLSGIAKANKISVAELQKINHITNPNQLKVGQKIILHEGDYLWRRPPIELVSEHLQKVLNMHNAAARAIVEYKRSHILLPKGNIAQKHAGDMNTIAIRGASSSENLGEHKKEKDIPHKTVEKNIKKEVKKKTKPAPLAKAPMQKTVSGLLFPLEKSPTKSYKTGMRRFGTNRSKGHRKHAGVDLYAPVGTTIRAMENGKVINVYSFYSGTHAIEIDHGTFIARYGEVGPDTILVSVGENVERGQSLAGVGKLNGLNLSMLHLEMYGTTESPSIKPLTPKDGSGSQLFKRRSDLIDPTASLDQSTMEK